ncbi:hypothetical protein [Enterococcus sp. DIV0240a]|uniref:hypothetical protein n=1 Tax=Enterococcus sp. DIV0240a TaxID=2774651 RepID=UPI003D2DB187
MKEQETEIEFENLIEYMRKRVKEMNIPFNENKYMPSNIDSSLNKIFNDEMINKINKALNIELYDWQIGYLRGDNKAIENKGRAAGKTYVQMIRIFMESDEPIYCTSRIDMWHYNQIVDAFRMEDPSNYYYYQRSLRLYDKNINKALKKAGISTRDVIYA